MILLTKTDEFWNPVERGELLPESAFVMHRDTSYGSFSTSYPISAMSYASYGSGYSSYLDQCTYGGGPQLISYSYLIRCAAEEGTYMLSYGEIDAFIELAKMEFPVTEYVKVSSISEEFAEIMEKIGCTS